MTRVDFYVIGPPDPDARLPFACRLADTAYRRGHRVYVHAPSPEAARRLDELMWTFRQDSFLPHALLDCEDCGEPPVRIGSGEAPWAEADVLVNLDPGVPLFFSRFERVMEVVTQDGADRSAGRERYRFYRDRGYRLQSHDLRGGGR